MSSANVERPWYKAKSASLPAVMKLNPPAMQETLVRFLGWEDVLEKGKATHSSVLAWRIPWSISFMGSQSQTPWATFTFFTSCSTREERGTTEDEMVGWHHQLNGHGFGWTPGVGDGQGSLACCDSWGCKKLDRTEGLNWTELPGKPSKVLSQV